MNQNSVPIIYETAGFLGEIHPDLFGPELEAYADRRVRMVVVTIGTDRDELLHQGTFYRPGRLGQPPEFGWRASGPLQSVLRQFRLEFLRHLGPAEMGCRVKLVIGDDTPVPPALRPRIQPLIAPAPMPPQNNRANHETNRPAAVAPPVAPAPPPPPREPISGQNPRPLPGNFYQDYFGFESMPFNNTPDTHFFYPSEKHQDALSRLIYAISERKGFVMISGAIGSGKSTLCRVLLGQLPRDVKTALITQTQLSSEQLVHAIAEDFGIETAGLSRYETLIRINGWLIEQLAAGTTPVLIIDEAQHLSTEVLEEVRMITNLETEQEKLLQLILLGQPELRDKIRQPELRQLRQRIAVQFHLDPLTERETLDYIVHRLKIGNPTRDLKFRRAAMREAYAWSGGVPRLINTLCDQALLTAFSADSREVTARMIREVAGELDLDPAGGSIRSFFKFW